MIGRTTLSALTFALALPLAAMVAPPAAIAAPAAPVAEAVSYGSHALQEIDFYRPADESAARSPLIVFVHGGAWAGGDKSDSTGAAKIRHYTEAGYALASVNYRLLPEAEIERQAEDVAAAVAQLVADSKKLGIDPHQIVLMGHSAGAHLSALIATDPRYLAAHDLRPSDIAGAILLDGPAYDVPLQIRDAGPFLGIAYQLAFGSGYARQDALSPAMHADGENARRFFMLHVERADAKAQAHALGDALTEAGTDARVSGFPGRGMEGHNLLNAMLGRSDSPATVPVDEWLAETFTSAG